MYKPLVDINSEYGTALNHKYSTFTADLIDMEDDDEKYLESDAAEAASMINHNMLSLSCIENIASNEICKSQGLNQQLEKLNVLQQEREQLHEEVNAKQQNLFETEYELSMNVVDSDNLEENDINLDLMLEIKDIVEDGIENIKNTSRNPVQEIKNLKDNLFIEVNQGAKQCPVSDSNASQSDLPTTETSPNSSGNNDDGNGHNNNNKRDDNQREDKKNDDSDDDDDGDDDEKNNQNNPNNSSINRYRLML